MVNTIFNWSTISAVSTSLAALAAIIVVFIYARMLKIMLLDLKLRQRPYLFVERLNAKVSGSTVPKDKNINVTPIKASESLDLQMENWIFIKNAGPIPAIMKPLTVEYRIDGKLLDTGVTTTKFAVVFPNQQAHNIATLQEGFRQVLRGDSILTLRIRIDYGNIESKSPESYFSDITLRYVINKKNLWACSWDYDQASGN